MAFLRKLFGGDGVQVNNLDVETYKADYFKQKNHTLIDVRSPSEFKSGHIPGAINIPLNQLAGGLSKIKSDKPVVVVCASGNRSRAGARIVAKAGYDDVHNLSGGTMRWQMRGFPVK